MDPMKRLLPLLLLLAVPLLASAQQAGPPREASHAGKPVSEWVVLLDSGDDATREAAAHALWEIALRGARLDDRVVPALAQGVEDSQPGVAHWCLCALEQLGDQAAPAFPQIVRALERPELRVRTSALEALVKVGPRRAEALQLVREALNDPSPRIRLAACNALGDMLPPPVEAVDALLVRLEQDGETSVRSMAAWAIGRVGAAAVRAIPALLGAHQRERDGELRRSLRWAIEAIDPSRVPAQRPTATPELTPPTSFDGLLEWLRVSDAAHNQVAVTALVRIGAPAVPALVEALEAGVARRDLVARGLASIGEPGLLALEASPHYAEPAVGRAIVEGVRGVGAPALDPLARLLAHPDATVRGAAAGAIGMIRHQDMGRDCVGPGDGFVSPTAAAYRATVSGLTRLLADPDPEARRSAAWALGELNEHAANAVPALLERLNDADDEVRTTTVRAIGSIGRVAPATADRLAEVLRSGADPGVRGWAAWACAQLEDHRSRLLPALRTAAIADPSAAVRLMAIEGLLEHGEDAVRCAALLADRVLSADDSQARAGALHVLRDLGPAASGSRTAVVDALQDDDPDVRETALEALIAQDARDSASVEAILRLLGEGAQDEPDLDAVAALGALRAPAAVPRLGELLLQEDEELRREALVALARIGEPALPVLVAVLEAPLTARERCEVVGVIGELGPEGRSALASLRELLQAEDEEVRLNAIAAIAAVAPGASDVTRLLVERLDDESELVQQVALKEIARLGAAAEAAVPALLGLLRGGNRAMLAAHALGEIARRPAEVVPALTAALARDPWAVKGTAAEALARFGAAAAPATDALLGLLAEEEPWVRQRATLALAAIGPQAHSALDRLRAANEADPTVRPALHTAIAAIDSDAAAALPRLLESLAAPDESVRDASLECLRWLGPRAAPVVPSLVAALEQPDEHTPFLALVETLGAIGARPDIAVPVLVRVLIDDGEDDEEPQTTAAIALGAFGPAAGAAVPALRRRLASEHGSVRAAAREALHRIGAAERR